MLGLQVAARELKILEVLVASQIFTKVVHYVTIVQIHLLKFDLGHWLAAFRNAFGEGPKVLELLDVDVWEAELLQAFCNVRDALLDEWIDRIDTVNTHLIVWIGNIL